MIGFYFDPTFCDLFCGRAALFQKFKFFIVICCSQKAHVQQFLATEDALNKAAEARNLCQSLIKRLHGNSDVVSSGISQNVGSLRQLEVNFSWLSIEVNYHGLGGNSAIGERLSLDPWSNLECCKLSCSYAFYCFH